MKCVTCDKGLKPSDAPTCPDCDGEGTIGDAELCEMCEGEGSLPGFCSRACEEADHGSLSVYERNSSMAVGW